MHKGKIIIKTKKKPAAKKVRVPKDLSKDLKYLFGKYGGIDNLVTYSQLSRNTIGAVKKSGKATPETIEKLKSGLSKMPRQAA